MGRAGGVHLRCCSSTVNGGTGAESELRQPRKAALFQSGWGEAVPTGFPDALLHAYPPVPTHFLTIPRDRQVVNDDAWLNGEFITTVQQRGAAIIKVGVRPTGTGYRGQDKMEVGQWGRGTEARRDLEGGARVCRSLRHGAVHVVEQEQGHG